VRAAQQPSDLSRSSDFELLYRSHRDAAIRLAWLLTHDAATAEDIAHDAFIALHGATTIVRDPHAYLRRTVINIVYERARRRSRELRRETLVAAGQSLSVMSDVPGVADVVARLPLDQRTAVVLRYWGGLRDLEIAEAMGIRPGTVRSHLSRATARLRKELR
jgi:DNA-directed RNA polymerase specialized sigma24 family protein